MKRYKFTFVCETELTEDQIWPDFDGPKVPSLADVVSVIAQEGGPAQIIKSWALDEDLVLTITDQDTDNQVRVLTGRCESCEAGHDPLGAKE